MRVSRETCKEYVDELEKLGYKLMELIGVSLGLPAGRFRVGSWHRPPQGLWRLDSARPRRRRRA